MGEQCIFKASNSYMVRKPIFSMDLFKEIYVENKKDEISELLENKIFLESLEVASENLNDAISRYKKKININKKEMFFRSINKYCNRITTRPTPFGLFSSVEISDFNDNSLIKIKELKNSKKIARIDSDWLLDVISILEIKEKMYKNIKLYKNSLISEEGSKVKNLYPIKYKKDRDKYKEEFCYINNSKSVKILLNKAEDGCFYSELVEIFNEAYPGITIDIINNFIEELIKKEFIITELKNSSNKENSLKYVIKTLKKRKIKNNILDELIEIDGMINDYNEMILGEGILLLKGIREKMKVIKDSKDLLQVDLSCNDIVDLNLRVKEEIESSINKLVSIAPSNLEYGIFNKYKEKFLEKYGTNKLISVLDLLDEEIGIGSPYDLEFFDEYENDIRNREIKKFFNNKFISTISEGKDEVVLKDEELECFKIEGLTEENVGKSMEVSFFISANNVKDIDDGKFKIFLGPNGGSDGAGKTFGRFLHVLDSKDNEKIKEISYKEDEIIGDDLEAVELNSIIQLNRVGNIMNSKNFRQYEINLNRNINSEKNIDINDIYVGIEDNRFYLKSKNLNKKIIVTTNHMLNNSIGNIVYRFLRDISEFNKINGLSFRYLINFDYDYIPRVRCGKLVIIPKSYKIKIRNFSKDDLKNKEVLKNIIVQYKEKFHMPDFVYITEYDNRMLINLNNEIHLNELYLTIKSNKDKEVLLQEFEGDINNTWSKYNFEFILPLIRNREYFSNKNKKLSLNALMKTKSKVNNFTEKLLGDEEERVIFPGAEWIYIKLYHNKRRVNELLGKEIYEFIECLKKEELLDNFFFIRYRDEEEHIRFRLKIKNINYLGEIFIRLNKWFNYLYYNKLIKNIVIDSYDRELERYGGLGAIKAAEEFFEVDSVNILKYINLTENKLIEFSNLKFAICNMISIMDNIGLSYENQLKIFDSFISKNKFRDKFLEDRKSLMQVANSDNEWENLRGIKNGEIIYKLVNGLGKAAKRYFKIINNIDDRYLLTNYKSEIMLSLFHMHCNRLFGIEREREEIAHSLVRHSLYALKYQKNLREKNE